MTNRPGIKPETLAANGIQELDTHTANQRCGFQASGLWIPYYDLDGKPRDFGRLRIAVPRGTQKYTQKTGSGQHLYLPKDFPKWERDKDLYLIEGEFKALSLAERGYNAIGLAGFYGFLAGDELAEVLAYLQPARVYWVGDADTLLNPDFYQATAQLTSKVAEVWDNGKLELVRMPWSGPKGADDMAQELNGQFIEQWEALPRVESNADALHLLEDLWGEAKDQVNPKDREVFEGICKTLCRFRLAPGYARVFDLVRDYWGYKAGTLRSGVAGFKKRESKGTEMPDLAALMVDRTCTTGTKWWVDINSTGEYVPLSLESWRNQLVSKGASIEAIGLAQAKVEAERFVHFAGPLCGRAEGVQRDGPYKLLVVGGPDLKSEPRPGGNTEERLKATFIGGYFWGILGENEMAWRTLIGWIKQARMACRRPDLNYPGQALVLVGETGIGKTLGQDVLTKCIGDRAANPTDWCFGKTPFNHALWGAEHLLLSDADVDDDWRARRKFHGLVKEVVANKKFPMNKKFCDAIDLKAIWRLSISCNTTPQSVLVIPPPEADTQDKLIYLWTEKFCEFDGDQEAFDKDVEDSLAEFCGCVDAWKVPKEMRDFRFGVKAWHDPKVIALVLDESLEGALEGVIQAYFEGGETVLEGTCAELTTVLGVFSDLRWIKGPRVLGRLLQKLSNSSQYFRYIYRRSTNRRFWEITPK